MHGLASKSLARIGRILLVVMIPCKLHHGRDPYERVSCSSPRLPLFQIEQRQQAQRRTVIPLGTRHPQLT